MPSSSSLSVSLPSSEDSVTDVDPMPSYDRWNPWRDTRSSVQRPDYRQCDAASLLDTRENGRLAVHEVEAVSRESGEWGHFETVPTRLRGDEVVDERSPSPPPVAVDAQAPEQATGALKHEVPGVYEEVQIEVFSEGEVRNDGRDEGRGST
ncbi:hypothetical protein K438DRAFT_1754853 [Mycena galopus ATCC 62051]|nr:hypothetical protein K438DRAFT_1754853 [Mycena galopus ATCC 62051]